MIQNNNTEHKLAIDEEKERLDKFYEILLRLDLRTIQRWKNEKESNNENKNKSLDNT